MTAAAVKRLYAAIVEAGRDHAAEAADREYARHRGAMRGAMTGHGRTF